MVRHLKKIVMDLVLNLSRFVAVEMASPKDDLYMNQPHVDSTVNLEPRALKTLARSISLSNARFALILVRSQRSESKADALRCLRSQYDLAPQLLEVPAETKQLYPLIQALCNEQQPSSLFISGLDKLTDLDEFLISINQMRDEFRRQFSFPLVLWVNDEIVQKLIKFAPDFYNWASVPISLA